MRTERLIPLGLLSKGESAEIQEVREIRQPCGECSHSPSTGHSEIRVEEIGLRTGKRVEMLSNEGRGALLVKVDESRIALARRIAMQVMVKIILSGAEQKGLKV